MARHVSHTAPYPSKPLYQSQGGIPSPYTHSLRLFLATHGGLYGAANGALGGELLPNHAVLVKRAADLLGRSANGSALCKIRGDVLAGPYGNGEKGSVEEFVGEDRTCELLADGATLIHYLGLGRGRCLFAQLVASHV